MYVFVFFRCICSGESATVLFSPTATNVDSEIFSYLPQDSSFQLKKPVFYLKIPKLVNLTSRFEGKSEIITSSPCKRKLRQDQEKITKTNKT